MSDWWNISWWVYKCPHRYAHMPGPCWICRHKSSVYLKSKTDLSLFSLPGGLNEHETQFALASLMNFYSFFGGFFYSFAFLDLDSCRVVKKKNGCGIWVFAPTLHCTPGVNMSPTKPSVPTRIPRCRRQTKCHISIQTTPDLWDKHSLDKYTPKTIYV